MLSASVRVAPCVGAAPCVDAGGFAVARPTSDISLSLYCHPNLTATRLGKPPTFPALRNQSPDARFWELPPRPTPHEFTAAVPRKSLTNRYLVDNIAHVISTGNPL